MRATILAGFLFLVPALIAQEQGQPQIPPKPATAAQQVKPAQANHGFPQAGMKDSEPMPAAVRAPAPGHPLDPRDVDILTGNADRESRDSGAYPYVYPYGGINYSTGLWGRRGNPVTRAPFLSRSLFRVPNERPFRVIRSPRAFFFFGW